MRSDSPACSGSDGSSLGNGSLGPSAREFAGQRAQATVQRQRRPKRTSLTWPPPKTSRILGGARLNVNASWTRGLSKSSRQAAWTQNPEQGPNGRSAQDNAKVETESGPLRTEREKPRSDFSLRGFGNKPGNDLLSHARARAVPSALEGLTSEFGMGSGMAPPTSSPEKLWWASCGLWPGDTVSEERA